MATLSAESALGASTNHAVFQTPDHLLTVNGQRLKFVKCDSLLEPDETQWHTASSPHGITLVAACPKAGLFAHTERTLQPRINVSMYPDMMPKLTLDYDCKEFTAIAFSRSGKHLAALTGLPTPTLVIWSLATERILSSASITQPCSTLSISPSSDGSLCSLCGKELRLWENKLVYETYLLSSTEVEAPAAEEEEDEEGDASASAAWTAHAWSTGDTLYASLSNGAVVVAKKGTPSTPVLQMATAVSGLHADGSHLTVACADGSITWFGLAQLTGAEEAPPLFGISLPGPVGSLVGSPDYLKLLASTDDGEMHLLSYRMAELPLEPADDAADVVTADRVAAFHTKPVIAAAILPLQVRLLPPDSPLLRGELNFLGVVRTRAVYSYPATVPCGADTGRHHCGV